jgi:DNA repair protein RecO (recombination protein O)
MGLIRSDGIILQTYPLSEVDRIIVLYSRGYGKLRAIARGARRIRSLFSGRLELFHWIDFIGYEKENQELVRIDKADLIASFGLGLPTYRSFLQFSVLAELLLKTVPEREPNDPLFRLLLIVLPEMRDPSRSDLAQLYFEIWHLKLAGLFPPSNHCSQCDSDLGLESQVFYSFGLHGFVCLSCKTGVAYTLSASSYGLLCGILRNPLSSLLSINTYKAPSSLEELSQLAETLLRKNFERDLGCLQLVREA